MTAEAQATADAPVIVKKYTNRRLYDTSKSAYVTLEDLCDMVKAGVEFEVKDAKSGDDLTRSVLTQIIFEQESKGLGLLPISFLRQIISFYDHNLSKVLPTYLEQSMSNFSDNQDKMRTYMDSLNDFSPFKDMQELTKKNMEMFEQTFNWMAPFGSSSDDKK